MPLAANWPIYSAGALALAGVGLLFVAYLPARKHKAPNDGSSKLPVAAGQAGRLSVMDGPTLIEHLHLQQFVEGCRARMHLDHALFKKDCLPVIHRAAEWVQLLPASESHHHAHPGGLMLHMMESVLHATRFREGVMLPVGASVEEMPARKHRWTYGVFLAALLHDIGRPIADINVRIYRSGKTVEKWHPLAGSMLEQNVSQYTLDFEIKSRNYELHKKLPIVLFQRLVPPTVLAWLAEDAQLMSELTSYLSGDEDYKGALREIVTRADSESVKANLMQGPRTRFATAKSVPLIERLMQALRMMLEEQGRISLNRPGAQGFVYDDSIWFVSKRLADDVRSFLQERESSEGIPGKDKNDRLFDTWQEYGALIPTPEHRAVWQATVVLDEGWEQPLTLLRFPLEKLYPSAARYPQAIRGKIIPAEKGAQPIEDAPSEQAETDVIEPEDAVQQAVQPFKPDVEPTSPPVGNNGLSQQADDRSPFSEPDSGAPIRITPGATPNEKKRPISTAMPSITPPPKPAGARQSLGAGETEFLEEDDAATASQPKRVSPPPEPVALRPVAPAGQTLPNLETKTKRKAPSAAAQRFMRWVQEGLASGDLMYNRADAMIHFVPEGMMLVSPAIFRRFAELFGEEGTGTPSDRAGSQLGTGIQRQVTNAGWNLQSGEKKSNIQRYTIIGLDGKGKNLISGVVIEDPSRFVNPLPPVNPVIRLFEKTID
jgi:integrating conjugative element relaxase (TIGR03760 family)